MAYFITTRRAIILGPRSFTDMQLAGQPISVQRSRSGRHASVTVGRPPDGGRLRGWNLRSRGRQAAFYGNTGLDLMMSGTPLPFAFYDVKDPGAMLAALDQVRMAAPSRL